MSAQASNIYVSGFHDWPDDLAGASDFNRWRCTINPSGRLFIGEWVDGMDKPDPTRGELPQALREITSTRTGRPIDWHFATLPVVWGVGASIEADQFDVVINIGYGTTHSLQTINLEKGAFNGRSGSVDAAANVPGISAGIDIVISQGSPEFRPEPHAQAVKLNKLKGPIGATGYNAAPVEARRENAFVCNETHDILLRRVGKGARPMEAYFIHIPKPPSDAGYCELSTAVARIVRDLLA